MSDTTWSPQYSALDIARALDQFPPTPEQRRVIEAPLESMLVVAGAGSGKTETMAGRVVWLVANGFVRPEEVLGLTFTRKGAGELGERISSRLRRLAASGLWVPQTDLDGTPGLGESATVSTYNAYAGRIVSEHGLRLGIEPDTRLLSEAAAWQVAHEAVSRWDGDMSQITQREATVTAGVLALSGELNEHLRAPSDLVTYAEEILATCAALPYGPRKRSMGDAAKALIKRAGGYRATAPLVERYRELKRLRGALDFSDQVSLAARLAKAFPQIGETERATYRTVLLDEFQDTSAAQIAFLASLFAGGTNRPGVTAVGDPHQSIFGWRGASATTLATFRREFAPEREDLAQAVSLSTSWRNDAAILAVANHIAAPLSAKSTVPVTALAVRDGAGPGRVEAARLLTTEDEAEYVAEWVARMRTQNGHKSAAVLCRRRAQFVSILEALQRRGVPAEAVGLGGLLETPEVVDLVSLLWVVDDPGRGDHFMRLLTGPRVRLSPADIEALGAWAAQLRQRHEEDAGGDLERRTKDLADDTRDDVSIVEAVDELPPRDWQGKDGQYLSEVARARLGALRNAINGLRGLTGLPLADFVGEAERVLGLDIEVLARPEYSPSTARAHLDAFADVAGTFSAQAERPTLGGFLDWLDAARSEERGLEMPAIEVNTDAVQVLTVHAAKGLEWDVVAVPGLVQGSFPSLDGTANVEDDAWGFKPSAVSGWVSGLDSIPYDLRGDAGGLPHYAWREATDGVDLAARWKAYAERGTEHALEEERRLAYVAFTRAKQHMLLTASVWAEAKAPRVTSVFLDEVVEARLAEVRKWADMPPATVDGEAPLNPLRETARAAQWPVKRESEAAQGLLAGAHLVGERMASGVGESADTEASGPGLLPLEGTREQRDLETALLLRERDRRSARANRALVPLPLHLSASAVVDLSADPETFARRLRRPMPSEPAVAARRGTAFHAWVEQHYSAAALVDVDELPGFDDENPNPDEDLERLKEAFLASEWADRSPLAVEVPVETVIEGYAIRGRIDAVFARPEGGVTIVDWKTGRRPGAEELRHRRLQLSAYALAYARLHRMPDDDVDAAFFYAGSGETYRPELARADEIGALLGQVTAPSS